MASITRTTTRPHSIVLMLDRFPNWPDPENSIGVSDRGIPFHNKTLWAMQGSALDAYQIIEHHIELCINQRGTDLYAKSPEADVPKSVGPFMWGKRKAQANPYIVICCEVRAVCQAIRNTIIEQDWWIAFKQNHAGFGRFLLSAHPPRPLALLDVETSLYSSYAHTLEGIQRLYSAPLWFDEKFYMSASSQRWNIHPHATLGGVLFFNDHPYGLTVSHASMSRGATRYSAPKTQHGDELFYVDDDGSDTNIDTDDVSTESLETADIQLQKTRLSAKSIAKDEAGTRINTLLGPVVGCSDTTDSNDWTLIDLANTIVVDNNMDRSRNQPILIGKQHFPDGGETLIYAPRYLKPTPPETVPICMIGRNGNLIQGSLGAGLSLVWLQNDPHPLRLMTAMFSECIQMGDCGMWVFNHHGDLYGYIVAGIHGQGITYLAPITRTIDAIIERMPFAPDDLSFKPRVPASESLRRAVINGHNMDVELLLAEGHDPNESIPGTASVLYEGVNQGHREVVSLLLSRGANVDIGQVDKSPVVRACELRDHDMLRLLLSFNANLERYRITEHAISNSPLYVAVKLGDLMMVEMLLKAGAHINEEGGPMGNALQAASTYGHGGVVRLLLEMNADVNAEGGPYSNALQAASAHGHEDIVKLLLRSNARPNAQGGEYSNALQAASINGDESIVKLLLHAGADVNVQGGHYGNVLQAASAYGRESIANLVLDFGADASAQGGRYGNALQAASYRGLESTVKKLLASGADVNAKGGYYCNALQAASHGGLERNVKLLLEAGADVNVQGGHYGNALQAASRRGRESTVKLLLAAGADVNAQGGYYGNALQAASVHGGGSMVKLLLSAGAEVNAQGGYYGNALKATSVHGHASIIKLLQDAGASTVINVPKEQRGNTRHATRAYNRENVGTRPRNFAVDTQAGTSILLSPQVMLKREPKGRLGIPRYILPDQIHDIPSSTKDKHAEMKTASQDYDLLRDDEHDLDTSSRWRSFKIDHAKSS